MTDSAAEPEDEDLLAAWGDGDEGAGRRLFARHFEALARFFRNKTERGHEDLIQRTFLAALEARQRFRGESSFRAYLFGIARNMLRRHWRDARRDDQFLDFRDVSVADLGASPSQRLAHDEIQHRLLLALRRIPLDYQIVLELHYWEDLTAGEIAVAIDVPVGTAKTRIRRAKQLLAGELDELTVGPGEATATRLETWARSIRGSLFSEAKNSSPSQSRSGSRGTTST